jgi:hypothetical protein
MERELDKKKAQSLMAVTVGLTTLVVSFAVLLIR